MEAEEGVAPSAPTTAKSGRFRRNRHEGEIDPAFKRAPVDSAAAEDDSRQVPVRREITDTDQQALLPKESRRSPRDDFGLNLPQFENNHDDDENKPLIESKPQQINGVELGHIPQREVRQNEEEDNTRADPGAETAANDNNKAKNDDDAKPYKRRFFSFRGAGSKNKSDDDKAKDSVADKEESSDKNGKKKKTKSPRAENNKNNNPQPNNNTAVQSKSDIPKYFRRIQYIRNLQDTFPINLFYLGSRWFNLGYETLPFQRQVSFAAANPTFDIRQYTQGWGVAVTCKSIHTYKKHVIGLVKPFVRIHVVYLDTGLYAKSPGEAPLRSMYTTPTLSIDSGSSAKWLEEVILDTEYADIVSENTILLFEVIDERPNLSTGGNIFRNRKLFHYKRIAWGYLLPIGIDGGLNVGLGNRKKENGHVAIRGNSGNQLTSEDGPQVDSPGNAGNNGGEHIHFNLPNDENQQSSEVEHSPLVPELQLNKLSSDQQQLTTASAAVANTGSVGSSHNNDLHLRIQLYDYRDYEGLIGFTQRKILTWGNPNVTYTSPEEANYPDNVPSIFLQWRLLQKHPIPGAFLKIAIGSRIRKAKKNEDEESDHHEQESQEEESDDDNPPPTSRSKKVDHNKPSKGKGKKRRRRPKSLEERAKLRAAVMRRSRGPKDSCVVPDKFLNRLEVGPEGAMVVAFSYTGHLLAGLFFCKDLFLFSDIGWCVNCCFVAVLVASKMTSYHHALSASGK
jgi:hypothetical protein